MTEQESPADTMQRLAAQSAASADPPPTPPESPPADPYVNDDVDTQEAPGDRPTCPTCGESGTVYAVTSDEGKQLYLCGNGHTWPIYPDDNPTS